MIQPLQNIPCPRCKKRRWVRNAVTADTECRACRARDVAKLERMQAALRKARDTFKEYARLHKAKRTPEGDEKAAANQALADELNEVLKETV